MARSNAVQFRGVAMVMEAYRLNDMAPFAVKSGPQILYASEETVMAEGYDELKSYLELCKKGGSEAYYTLCVYKLKKGEDITDKTGVHRSFNFTLYNEEQELSPYSVARGSFAARMQEQLDEMKGIILSMQAEKQEEPEKASPLGGLLNGLMEDPDFKKELAMKAIGIVRGVTSMFGPKPVAAIGGMGEQAGTLQSILTQEQVDKVHKAMNVLCAKDPELGDNLLKVADLVLTNPGKYKMALTML